MVEHVSKIFYWMLAFIPISWISYFILKNNTITFITVVLALIPLAAIIGYATRQIVIRSNPTVAGLLNATFGNIIELIIAVIALSNGLIEVVKASITGSIIANILLLIGLSVFFGGLKYKEQHFNKDSAGVASTMLIIAVAGLAIPTAYSIAAHPSFPRLELVSDSVAIVLAIIYIAGLIFSLKTHKDMFDGSDEIKALKQKPQMSTRNALLLLILVVVVVGAESELLVNSLEAASHALGFTDTFIGIVVIAILTNIAEKITSITFAVRNNIDVSLEIGMGSALQIALFVVPILVFISTIFGFGFSLVFSVFEIIAVIFTTMIINYLSADGRCNWLEGAQLISLYLIIAIVFFFI